MTDNKLREKIAKLLALAGNNPNEHERGQAMERARQLMLEHDLSEAECVGLQDKRDVIELSSRITTDKWQRIVCQAAAMLYDCKTFYDSRMWFVGFPAHAQVANEFAEWLINGIRKESNKLYAFPTNRRSFRLGAAYAIDSKAKTMVEADQQNAPSSANQLMRLNAVEAYFDGLDLRSAKSRPSIVSSEALAHGQQYGANVALNKQVSTATMKRIGG